MEDDSLSNIFCSYKIKKWTDKKYSTKYKYEHPAQKSADNEFRSKEKLQLALKAGKGKGQREVNHRESLA